MADAQQLTTAARWATTKVPRHATFDVARPEPAAYLVAMLRQALRHGLPARRPAGPVVARLGRHGFPQAPVAAALRRLPTRSDPALDDLLAAVRDGWPQLAERSRRLPAAPPALTALAIERSAARTVFVFGGPAPSVPLVVVKQAGGSRAGVDVESAALRAAEAADAAPRLLGELEGAPVQEGLPGEPLHVRPVTPGTAAALPSWSAFGELGDALARLAVATARPARLDLSLLAPLDAALSSGLLSSGALSALAAARSDLAQLDVSVLQHGDLSAQNWLVGADGFVGLVDWETATPDGVPGFDALHAGVSLLEHGVGLVRWSEERVARAFEAAWASSALFDDVRSAFRTSASAAGVPDRLLPPLQAAFFARRVGRRVQSPGGYAVGARTAAAMVEVVCGS